MHWGRLRRWARISSGATGILPVRSAEGCCFEAMLAESTSLAPKQFRGHVYAGIAHVYQLRTGGTPVALEDSRPCRAGCLDATLVMAVKDGPDMLAGVERGLPALALWSMPRHC